MNALAIKAYCRGFALKALIFCFWGVCICSYGQSAKTSTKPTATKTQVDKTKKSNSSTAAKTSSRTDDKIKNLNKQKSNLEQKGKETSSKIEENKKSVKAKLAEVSELNEDIRRRAADIDSQSTDIKRMGEHIEMLEESIKSKQEEYNQAKSKYVKLIYHAYQKNSVYDRLLFLFSANTLQESYHRFQYIREFAKLRRQQAENIRTSHEELVAAKTELETSKIQSQNLLADRESEKSKLEKDKAQQSQLLMSLKKEEKELQKQLADQKKATDALNKEINKLIAEEAARVAKMTAQQQKKPTTQKQPANKPAGNQQKGNTSQNNTAKNNAATPSKTPVKENTQVDPATLSFEKQKGKLPFPVKSGFISGHYGKQTDPVTGKDINNLGVYISTAANSDALAVADGEVTSVFSIAGSNKTVIVRHGAYLTVYANLTSVKVEKGQKVKQGSVLGGIYKDPNKKRYQIYFLVYKEKTLQNPEIWLKK